MRSFALSRGREPNYPGAFQEIRQFIGDVATAKLVAQYGGTRLYIPITLKREHPLCQLLGEETAQQLAGEFCGMSVEVPRDVMLQLVQRNKLILADSEAGMSQSQLALKYGLTQRTIRKITSF